MDLVSVPPACICQPAKKPVSEPTTEALTALEERLGHRFTDKALLLRALTHSSYGDGRGDAPNNERLEFLGDRVLGLLAARFLFLENRGFDEGDMAPRLNTLVRKETCADAARLANLGEALRLSKAETRSGGRDKTKILGDVCEAVLAALYLDGGMEAASHFFETYWAENLRDVMGNVRDPKSHLQEWAQSEGGELPVYTLKTRQGPDHAPQFVVEVQAKGQKAIGTANSKQEAERQAAREILKQNGHTHD